MRPDHPGLRAAYPPESTITPSDRPPTEEIVPRSAGHRYQHLPCRVPLSMLRSLGQVHQGLGSLGPLITNQGERVARFEVRPMGALPEPPHSKQIRMPTTSSEKWGRLQSMQRSQPTRRTMRGGCILGSSTGARRVRSPSKGQRSGSTRAKPLGDRPQAAVRWVGGGDSGRLWSRGATPFRAGLCHALSRPD